MNPSELTQLKNELIMTVARAMETPPVNPSDNREFILQHLEQAYARFGGSMETADKERLFQEVINEVAGFGPIQPLLDDPEISEVMVNAVDKVYVERAGRITKTDVTFENPAQIMKLIERIVLPLGRFVDADNPTVDARLPDGSRVNAAIPPIMIDGPCITIRKFQKDKLTFEDLVNMGSISANMVELLRACVIGRLNILVSGGTGSGKTTLLNILSGFIPAHERIITIEDAAELALRQEHVLRMETKQANVEGRHAVTTRDLVKNTLRMRPDRIIVGECRGGEALDMLQAMNTGHDGSLTTVHANTPRDAISRLETLTLMAGIDLPVRVIRKQIASAIDVVIQTSRLNDGSRKVTSIAEISGMEGETITMSEIFKFQQSGVGPNGFVIGELQATGTRPFFSEQLKAAGLELGGQLFRPSPTDW